MSSRNFNRLSCVVFLFIHGWVWAGEPADEKFLGSMHLALNGERMSLIWTGPSPDIKNVKSFDVKIFANNPEKKALSFKAKERNAPKRDISATATKDGAVSLA